MDSLSDQIFKTNSAFEQSIGDYLYSARSPGANYINPDGTFLTQSAYPNLFAAVGLGDKWVNDTAVTLLTVSKPLTLTWADWSVDGSLLVLAGTQTPFMTVCTYSSGVLTKLANPTTLPANSANCIAVSADNSKVAVAHGSTPFVSMYSLVSGVLTKLANPSSLPPNGAVSCAYQPGGTILAVGHNATPFLTLYDYSTGTYVKMTDPASLPANVSSKIKWSPNGRYLAVLGSTSPFLQVYDLNSGVPVRLTAPTFLPTSGTGAIIWSSDSTTVTATGGVNARSYDVTSGTLVGVPGPGLQNKYSTTTNLLYINYSPDFKYLMMLTQISGSAYMFRMLDTEHGYKEILALSMGTSVNPVFAVKHPTDDLIVFSSALTTSLNCLLPYPFDPATQFQLPVDTDIHAWVRAK